MNVTKVNERLHAHQVTVYESIKHREEEYKLLLEKQKVNRIEETRVARARRLGLEKGQHLDIFC